MRACEEEMINQKILQMVLFPYIFLSIAECSTSTMAMLAYSAPLHECRGPVCTGGHSDESHAA